MYPGWVATLAVVLGEVGDPLEWVERTGVDVGRFETDNGWTVNGPQGPFECLGIDACLLIAVHGDGAGIAQAEIPQGASNGRMPI